MIKKNRIKNSELKQKWQELQKRYLNSKEISSEKEYSFNFKNSSWSLTIIYLTTFVIIPIIYSFIKTYGFSNKNELTQLWSNIDLVVTYYIPIFGMILALIVDWQALAVKGAWAAYSHFIFKIVSIVVIGLILSRINIIADSETKKQSIIKSISFLIQIVFQTIGSAIIIFTNKRLRKQIITTFKEAKIDLLTWILIFLSLCSILIFIFEKISNTFNSNSNSLSFYSLFSNKNNKTANQVELELMMATPIGITILIIGAIFLAPINEELSYRYGIFSIVGNKWLGFATSVIYFPSMHIMGFGDWHNILGYGALGLMAPLLFIFTRGNVAYTIGLHTSLNAISIFSLLLGLNK